MATVGVRINIDGDSSGAVRAVNEAQNALNKLSDDVKNFPTFMGSGVPIPGSQPLPRLTQPTPPAANSPNGQTYPGTLLDSRGNPFANSQPLPRLIQQPLPYGANYSYGQMSPNGIAPDGRKIPDIGRTIATLNDRLEELGDTIKDTIQNIQDARDNGDSKAEGALSGTLENQLASKKQIENEKRALEKDGGDLFGKYFLSHVGSQITSTLAQAGNAYMGSRKALAGGDALGSAVQEERGIGQMIGGGVKTALFGGLSFTPLGPLGAAAVTSVASPLIDFLSGLKADETEEALAYSAQYKNALPAMEGFYQRYGQRINIKDGATNASEALDWYNKASGMSMGTGKTTEELIEASRNRGAYGNISAQEALYGGRQDIMWERFTGASLSNIQRMAGLGMRYGGDANAVQTAYAGLTASGMGKGQLDEYMTALQRVMEDGIEKGFMKGANEIAGNMTLLSKLSGGSAFWTGEQGANRLMKMNEAISSATGLKSVEDVLSFGVARDLFGGDEGEFSRLTEGTGIYTGTYVDTMQLLERGVSPELLEGQFKAVRELEGDRAGQIERFMKMYNLNYTGGAQVWEMANKPKNENFTEMANKIKEFQTRPEYQSDSQKLTDIMTKISTDGINIGKIHFDKMEIPTLEKKVGEIHKELEKLTQNKDLEARRGENKRLFDELSEESGKIIFGTEKLASDNTFLDNFKFMDTYKNNKGPLGLKEDYGEMHSVMFNNLISGIDDPSMIDDITASMIKNYAQTFRDLSGGGINRDESNTLREWNRVVSNLIEALYKTKETTVVVRTED